MPDHRLIHRRALRGEKVGKLTDFERGVWWAYLLISDDYGVMPFDAGELARAIWLKAKPRKVVQAGFAAVANIGLINTWTHQGEPYCYAPDWQKWQKVKHPRNTIEPCPPAEELARCDAETQELFREHQRHFSKNLGNISQDLSEVGSLARAGGRETLTLTQTQTSNADANAARPARGVGTGVMAGALPRDHMNCHQPCVRMCVSERQHAILRERHGGTDADMDAFYAEVRERLVPGVPLGDRPWDFWDKQFAAKFGSAAATVGKTAGNAAAAARFIARGQR